jgi:general stress protein YciG
MDDSNPAVPMALQDPPPEQAPKPKQHRGFAAMDPERRREIARQGGAAVAPANRSFAKSKELAASAGKKGGSASRGGGRPAGATTED